MENRKPRIFMGLIEISGYYSKLQSGFRELGYEADFIALNQHPFAYQGPDSTGPFLHQLRLLRNNLPKRKQWYMPHKLFSVPLYVALSFIFFLWTLTRYDVYIFGGRSHFLPAMLDLPLLRLCGKKLIFVFHGSDSRPPYLNGANVDISPDKILRSTKKIKREIQCISRFAHTIIDNPPACHFHSRNIVKWLSIGIPISSDYQYEETNLGNEIIRVVHAPSRPSQKGSHEIKAAITELQADGLPIHLDVIVDRPNIEVLDALGNCHFVVDQLYCDTPMAGFATEAAWFGKPSIVGGYEIDKLTMYTSEEERPPSHIIEPKAIKSAIRLLATDKSYRNSLGLKAQKFVREQWRPSTVAYRYIKLIEDNYPQEWLWNPHTDAFVHGWGLSLDQGSNLLRSYIESCGTKQLFVGDKPDLYNRLLEYSQKTGNAAQSG